MSTDHINSKSSVRALILIFSTAILGCGGYGEVSRKTYEFSMALYSACQSRSDERLSKIEELLSEANVEELPANERRWLEAIIARAQNNHWEAAANNARQMMEDQVTY